MKTKAQYEAANANDWVGFGGTINKGCSVPVGGVGTTHYWIWGLQDPPFPTLQTLSSQKGVGNLAGFPAPSSSHLENII